MSELNELFSSWRGETIHSDKLFITDGPIDPDRWNIVEPRVLFVAKEAYGEEGDNGTWDLPTLVREEWGGPKYKFWWTVGYWALALRNTTIHTLADFPEYTQDYKPVRDAVLSSAILNLKKSSGVSVSDDEDLRKYVEADAEYIRRELELLNPHIVLCCSTWHLFGHLLRGVKEISQFVMKWGEPPRVVIDYWHPANQLFPNSVMFYALSAIYQKSLMATKEMEADVRLHKHRG